MFNTLGRFVARHPGKIILIWAALAALAWFTAPPWEQSCQDDDIRLLPERCLSVQGHRLLKQAFPQEIFGSKVVFALERQTGPLAPADLKLVDALVAEIESCRAADPQLGLGAVSSYRDPVIGFRLLSKDKQCTLIMAAIETPLLAFKTTDTVQHVEKRLLRRVERYRQEEVSAGRSADDLSVATTGSSGLGRDLNAAAYRSLDQSTIATVLLVLVVLLLVYRSWLLALVPIATIGVSVWLSLKVLALLTLIPDFQVVNITRVFVVVVLFGAGTDYCLFLISRYREQCQEEECPEKAMWLTLRRVGWALCASAGTVVCGLGMMGFAEFAKLRYTGPAIALSLVIALAASLTLAPALIRLLSRWTEWPKRYIVRGPWRVVLAPLRAPSLALQALGRLKPESDAKGGHGVLVPKQELGGEESETRWDRFSNRLAARPLLFFLAGVAGLMPFAILGFRTQYVYDFCAELPRTARSIQGIDMIRRHFIPGELGPLTVLLVSADDWSSPTAKSRLREITTELARMDNVAEVRSLTAPRGTSNATTSNTGSLRSLFNGLVAGISEQVARRRYTAQVPDGFVAKLEVVFHTDPFTTESLATMHRVQDYLDSLVVAGFNRPADQGRLKPATTNYALFGITAMTHDLADVHEADRVFVNGLVLAGIMVILTVLVRRPVVAFYLLLTVLFSYYATIGLTELLSLGWLDSSLGQVDWKVPYFLFTILVAIGEDYNIFLMTRVLEEARQHGMREGTRRALARTGGTITACGLIMAGTFATLMLCKLTTLIQIGLALAVGVLLDTFVVRPILVPAFLLMFSRDRVPEPIHRTVLRLPRRLFQRAA